MLALTDRKPSGSGSGSVSERVGTIEKNLCKDPDVSSSSLTASETILLTPERSRSSLLPTKVDVASSPASTKSSLTLGEAPEHDLMARIETLSSRLSEAKVDLSEEKALRRKRETSIVKLADELKKRASETQAQAEEIAKVSKMLHVYVEVPFFRLQSRSLTPF